MTQSAKAEEKLKAKRAKLANPESVSKWDNPALSQFNAG